LSAKLDGWYSPDSVAIRFLPQLKFLTASERPTRMRLVPQIFFRMLLLICLGTAFGQTTPNGSRSLGDIARETREQKRSKSPDSSPKSAQVRRMIADIGLNDPEEYQGKMAELLSRQDFDGLDHAADTARSTKSRFPGATWKLYDFYDSVSKPSNGSQAGDADWNSHIALLKKWVSLKPQSITARIALAETYINYGQNARGNGYSDTVTDEGWRKHGESASLALTTLKEASALPEKCPYWYEAMMHVALAQGWSSPATKAVVEELISFEPTYYHVYREYANYLQPKWYGEEGDSEAFANMISKRIGGEEGSFIYFEIASLLNCGPCDDGTETFKLSWPKVKEGYAALEHLYGTSDLKMNRFAYMASKAGDKPVAKEIFSRIGTRWDQKVWRSRQRFETAKAWALN